MLPGPASTQTIMLIGWKRGGPLLGVLTLLVWILPAALLMAGASFLMTRWDELSIHQELFRFVHPMTIGFVVYTALKMMHKNVTHLATYCIMIGSTIVPLFFHSPWVFPILMLIAGFITNLTDKRIPQGKIKPIKIKWVNIRLYVIAFVVLGILSEVSRYYNWEHGRLINLSENFYRFGSFVFGGGQVLLPMMLFQFVTNPINRGGTPYMTSGELMSGFGIVQALPGPVFSVCVFAGGMAMNEFGPMWQWLGCAVSLVSIYLPSVLMVLFFYPIYQNLKHHVMIFRALEGIYAVIIGIIWASALIFFKEIYHIGFKDIMTDFDKVLSIDWMSILAIPITFIILKYTKIPPPLIVVFFLILGYLI